MVRRTAQSCSFRQLNVVSEFHVQHTVFAATELIYPAGQFSSNVGDFVAGENRSKMVTVTADIGGDSRENFRQKHRAESGLPECTCLLVFAITKLSDSLLQKSHPP